MLELLAAAVAERLRARGAGCRRVGAYLDVEAAAEYLAAPTSRVYDLAASGRLRVVRDGRRVLTRASWIDAMLDAA
ncbi:MAG: excisionase family DNA-binding protein [Solirubrobacteraceae bacterium]